MVEITRREAVAGLTLLTAGARAAAAPRADLARQLAPSGRMRAAINVGNVVLAQRGGPSGAKGPSVDIANEIARRLGVPIELMIYDAAGAVVDALAGDHWDVAFMGIDPQRADAIAFTAPYLFIDGTYLVADARFQHAADLDQAGVRIAVGQGAAYDLYLSRALRHATLVRSPTSPAAIGQFVRDKLDAAAGVRQALVQAQATLPGTRVLADSFNRIEQAVAIPKGRDAGFAYVAALVEELKASGFIRGALDAAGQSDTPVAPPAKT